MKIERVVNYVPDYPRGDSFYVIDKDSGVPVKDRSGKGRVFSLDEAQEFVRSKIHVSRSGKAITPIDIFEAIKKHRGTKTVYVVCPGANGKDYYKDIPDSAVVIAVNKGAEFVDHVDYWLVADSECPDQEWWERAYFKHSDKLALISSYPHKTHISHAFEFNAQHQLEIGNVAPEFGYLRTGATVGAMAIQLAYWMRPHQIILIGMDMRGNTYSDGSKNRIYQHRKNRAWNVVPRINALLAWCYAKGVVIRSLSDTELDIPSVPSGVDIWQSGLKFNGDVYIVGTGPRGREHYGEIPHDAQVIVVNAAINIMGIPKMLWMCEDATLPDQEWFQDAARSTITCKNTTSTLQDRHYPTAAFIDKPVLNNLKAPISFKTAGYLGTHSNDRCRIVPGKTYGAATIACRAMQIVCQMGATRVILCGIDMFGSGYFDGSQVAGKFMDARHNSTWATQKECFDKVIEWAWDEMGIETYSLSETALKTKGRPPLQAYPRLIGENNREWDPNLPVLAYMTMTLQPRRAMDAIAWCAAQYYPDDKKILYLMTQEPFPQPIIHDLPFPVIQVDVPGEWPGLWAKKLWRFLAVCKEEIMLVWDEDDCFMPDYTIKAISPLIESNFYDFAWCYDMRFIEKVYSVNGTSMVVSKHDTLPAGGTWHPSCQKKRHQSAIGTLVARVGALRKVAAELKINHPNGLVEVNPGQYSGPIDNYLRRLLQNQYKDKLTEHAGNGRWYYIHTKASSKYGRRKEGYIDG